ncbi:FtsX-like permease family protein [Ruminococcaceae bacterium OttesenSCG-928-A16]|nr:FtsX-like permease family protein [Ruminococcaceae bacterium OttesenSCG-928-A16]
MIRKNYRKNIFREIKSTLNRFVAIFAITALGAGFYAGLKATGPDMRNTANHYYHQQQLMDFRLLSTFGFTQDDITALRALPEVEQVMPSYTLDVLMQAEDGVDVVRLHGLPANTSADNPEYLNQVILTEGRMPTSPNECLADSGSVKTQGYKIGDTFTLAPENEQDTTDLLAEKSFTVVGLAVSPYYITFQRGNTNIGDGTLDMFLYLPPSSFDSEYYTEVLVAATGASQLSAFSQQYTQLVDDGIETLEDFGEERAAVRYNDIKKEGTDKLNDARQELAEKQAEADEKLGDAEKTIADGEAEIRKGKAEIAKNQKKLDDGETELNNGAAAAAGARTQLEAGQAEYDNNLLAFNEQKAAYDAANAQLEQTRQMLTELQANLTVLGQLPAQMQQLDAAITPLEELEQQGLLTPEQQAQLEELRAQRTGAEEGFILGMGQVTAGLRNFANGLELQGEAEQAAGLRTAADTADALVAAGGYDNYNAALAVVNAPVAGIQTQLEAAQAELDAALPALQEGEAALAAAKATLDSGWGQLHAAEGQLAAARAEIEEGKVELAKARKTLANAEKELADGRLEYETEKADAEKKLAEAGEKIEDAQKELDDLEKPTWYVTGRDAGPGYSGFDADSKRIDAISQVFPVFFFLVAALVCLTTMTRMVEDQRTQIGTLKALGFSKGSIAFKYIFYAGLASLTGSIVGVIAGFYVFPGVIWAAYQIMYLMPNINRATHIGLALGGIIALVLCTTLATVAACYNELRSVPAQLMRPKAPRPGKRVLLERAPFIWNRLNFSHKVTVRNLFRYKKRFFMTVIGVAGCTALLLTGFGLKDSIAGIAGQQYGVIDKYDMMVYTEDATSGAADTRLNKELQTLGQSMYVSQDAIEAKSANGNSAGMTVNAFTMETPEEIDTFVHFQNRQTGASIPFPQGEGVVVTEKLASRLKIEEGDTIELGRTSEKTTPVTVVGIMENYIINYVYMTPATYQKVFEQPPEFKTALLKLNPGTQQSNSEILSGLVNTRGVAGAASVLSMTGQVDDMLESLNQVIWVIVAAAAMLAIVVLYNLTNINITERVREIATLKVLGFYNGEVAGYVFRENVLLTLISIAVGLVGGIFLHRFVIVTAEIDEVMFRRIIEPLSYVWAGLFTMLANGAVSLVMARKLKKIDMVESLKSAE